MIIIRLKIELCDSDYCYPQRSTGYVIKIKKIQQKILQIKKQQQHEITLILYQTLSKFIIHEPIENGKGLKIKQFMDNEYGNYKNVPMSRLDGA